VAEAAGGDTEREFSASFEQEDSATQCARAMSVT
jgi:hypothetical protein